MKEKKVELMWELIKEYIWSEIKSIMLADRCELKDVNILQVCEEFTNAIDHYFYWEDEGESWKEPAKKYYQEVVMKKIKEDEDE